MRWDDDVDTGRQNRVSLWEIEPNDSVSGTTGLSAFGSKITKICLHPSSPNFSVPSTFSLVLVSGARVQLGTLEFSYKCTGFGESVRFHKALQVKKFFL